MYDDPNAAYRRPQGQPAPAWTEQPSYHDGYPPEEPYEPPFDDPPYDDPPYADPPYADPYDDPAYDDASAYDEPVGRTRDPLAEEETAEVIATNRTVLLTCTLESMVSLFALFLLFAEKRSHAIRHFAVQSVGLSVCHLLAGGVLLLIGGLLGVIPILGFLVSLICWLMYIVVAIVTVFLRVKMMLNAWRGFRFDLPLIGSRLAEHFC